MEAKLPSPHEHVHPTPLPPGQSLLTTRLVLQGPQSHAHEQHPIPTSASEYGPKPVGHQVV